MILVSLLWSAIFLCSHLVYAKNDDKQYNFKILEKTLGKALDKLVEQTGTLVLYPYEFENTKGINPVIGRYTVLQAFQKMLKGTSFSGGLSENGVLTISHRENAKNANHKGNQGREEVPIKNRKRGLLATVSALFFGSAAAVNAEDISASNEFNFEEIVVTAQKRSQSLQDVSIAITAFTGDNISKLGVNNLEQLTEFVAGVELFDDRGAGQPTWVIRGVGLADFNSNNTPTAAVYYDEYYLTSNTLSGIGMFDIGAVEILKGPQGGLYGRNTSGGAVRVMSVAPVLGEDLNGYTEFSYGKWGQYGAEAAVGGALSERVAFRLSGMIEQGGGWQDSLATSEDDNYGDRDFFAVRGQILMQLSEAIDVKVKLEAGHNKSETTLGYALGFYDPETGDFCASALAGFHDEKNCASWYNITNFFAISGEYGIPPSEQKTDGSVVLSKPINRLDDNWFGINTQINIDLGFATLTSITGYLDYNNRQQFDYDASPLTLFEEDGSADLTSWSQEMRLVSNEDDPLAWILGAMYAEDSDDEFRLGDLRDNILVLPVYSRRSFRQETKSWALYAQLDYQVADSVKIHGSARYTNETKDYLNGELFDVPSETYYFKDFNFKAKLGAHWSGHIGIDWSPSDATLLYARATKGFKSGGFFGGFGTDADQLAPYKEETVFSYEVGLKTSLLEKSLRFNMAAFLYDYRDVQGWTQEIGNFSGTVATKLGNIGDAKHKGIEVDMLWVPRGLPGFTLQGSAAWLDTEITNSDTISLDPSGVEAPIEGLERSFAPNWSYTALARYEWSLSEKLKAGMQLNYTWRDNLVDMGSLATVLSYAAYGQEGYGVLNGRISLGAENEKWELSLSAHNLTNKEYLLRSTGDDLLSFSAFMARPMNYTLALKVRW